MVPPVTLVRWPRWVRHRARDFLREEPVLTVRFFSAGELSFAALALEVFDDAELAFELDRSFSIAAPAASGRVSTPLNNFSACSRPAATVFEAIRCNLPDFIAITDLLICCF